jgi:hypothetical protein
MKKFPVAFLVCLLLASAIFAQEKKEEKKEPKKKIKFDYSYEYDPRELHEYSQEIIRWKRIKGIVGVGGYVVPAGLQPGPNAGPIKQIWGQGFGTSLWRDPVTGWPIM